jgi:hypothetical protein
MGLGIAAAHRHHGSGAGLLDPVDDLARLLVGHSGDGAGVDDIRIRLLLKIHHLVAPLTEHGFHGLGLILIHFTAKGINGNFHGFLLAHSMKDDIIVEL